MKRAPQRLTKCPQVYQDRLTRAGGLNRYGGPNFKLAWGESETMRAGGIWEQDDGNYFRGYRDIAEDGRPCWVLKQWKPPEVYGTPAMYFAENLDPNSGFQILGDYPWRGKYETIQPLVWRGLVNGRMVVEHMPLNSLILDMVVPIIIRCRDATWEQKKAAVKDMEERKNRDDVNEIEARRNDARMAFTGPVSYARQGCKTSLVDRKIYEMQKHFNSAMSFVRQRGLGTSIA